MRRELLPTRALPAWMRLHGVQTSGVEVRDLECGRGRGIIATSPAKEEGTLFVNVPSGLVLNVKTVWSHAKLDKRLRQVLEANGDFAKTPRGAILIFLLMQIVMSSLDMPSKIGVSNPWSEYVKFVATETSLPIFWTEAERQCLWGTSLENHVAAKLKALDREFADFRSATEDIDWCAPWWDPVSGIMTLEDWKTVDAIHRSRSMDFSQYGICLVPIMDMANHDKVTSYKATYTVQEHTHDARLALEWERAVKPGDEVTIMYGFERGAADSVFSYGFIEPGFKSAHSVFLGMDPPEDDPLARAKLAALALQPGIKISELHTTDKATWNSGFVWAMCVNEEDGLEIRVARTIDGEKELEVAWKGEEVRDQGGLERRVKSDKLCDLFMLRAFTMAHERIQAELDARETLVYRSMSEKLPPGMREDSRTWKLAEELRRLEKRLLRKALDNFWATIVHLTSSEGVARWFKMQAAAERGEDFYEPDYHSSFCGPSDDDDDEWPAAGAVDPSPADGADRADGADLGPSKSIPCSRWASEVDEGEAAMRKLALHEDPGQS